MTRRLLSRRRGESTHWSDHLENATFKAEYTQTEAGAEVSANPTGRQGVVEPRISQLGKEKKIQQEPRTE